MAEGGKTSLKQKVENNFIAVFFTGCATVAVVAAGAGVWIGEQRVQTAELSFQNKIQAERFALNSEHSNHVNRISADFSAAIDDLEQALEEVKEERDQLLAFTDVVGGGAANCSDPAACRGMRLGAKVIAILDPDAVSSRGVAAYFNNRVFAMKDGDSGVRQLPFPLGANQRFLYDPAFDLENARPGDGAAQEQFWLLSESAQVSAHPLFKRFAPFFVVYKMPFVGDAAEAGAGRPVDPAWQVFMRDFRDKFESANSLGLRMRVKRIEQEGVVLFAHFVTVLRNIEVGGERHDRLFLNEMQFVVPVRNDGVYVVKSAFTSDVADHRKSAHWLKMLEWWDKLQINVL